MTRTYHPQRHVKLVAAHCDQSTSAVVRNIFFNIMGFSSSPEVDEPSLGGTNDKG
jgi:hypothetical protein